MKITACLPQIYRPTMIRTWFFMSVARADAISCQYFKCLFTFLTMTEKGWKDNSFCKMQYWPCPSWCSIDWLPSPADIRFISFGKVQYFLIKMNITRRRKKIKIIYRRQKVCFIKLNICLEYCIFLKIHSGKL